MNGELSLLRASKAEPAVVTDHEHSMQSTGRRKVRLSLLDLGFNHH